MSATYDTDKAMRDCQRLWRKVAKVCEEQAMDAAENSIPNLCLQYARIAEAAYWQAAGDCEPAFISELATAKAGAA